MMRRNYAGELWGARYDCDIDLSNMSSDFQMNMADAFVEIEKWDYRVTSIETESQDTLLLWANEPNTIKFCNRFCLKCERTYKISDFGQTPRHPDNNCDYFIIDDVLNQ